MSKYSSQEFDSWDDMSTSMQEQVLQTLHKAELGILSPERYNKKQRLNNERSDKVFQVYRDTPISSTQQIVSTTTALTTNTAIATRPTLRDATNQRPVIDSMDDINNKGKGTPATTTTACLATTPPERMNSSNDDDVDDDDMMWLDFDDMDIPSLLENVENLDNQHHQSTSEYQTAISLEHVDDILQRFGGFKTAGSNNFLKPSDTSLKAAHNHIMASASQPFPSSSLAGESLSQSPHATNSSPPPSSRPPLKTECTWGFSTARGTRLKEPSMVAKMKAQQLLLSSAEDTLPAHPCSPNITTVTTIDTNKINPSTCSNVPETTRNSITQYQSTLSPQSLSSLSIPPDSCISRHSSSRSSSLSASLSPTAATIITTDINDASRISHSSSASLQYEDLLHKYGGFNKASGEKTDIPVSEEAKQQALLLFMSDIGTIPLTQSSLATTEAYIDNEANNSTIVENTSVSDSLLGATGATTTIDNSILNSSSTSTSVLSMCSSSPSASPSTSSSRSASCQPQYSEQMTVSQSSAASQSSGNIPITLPAVSSTPTIPTGSGRIRPRRRNIQAEKRPQSKPFKSPAIDLELVKAGLEKRMSSSNVNRMKGPSVFNLQTIGCRRPLSSLGVPVIRDKQSLFLNNDVPADIVELTPSKARSYQFKNGWGVEQAKNEILDAGCLPHLLPKGWVENHYGWILWKLARRFLMFPQHYKAQDDNDWWSPTHVVEQLLYRYEREINLGHRSVIKRIMENDDTPIKQMVLMIADIILLPTSHISHSGKYLRDSQSGNKYRLQLTDGWYQISTMIDARMTKMINKRHLHIGQKLSITGAQLIGDRSSKTPLEGLIMADSNSDNQHDLTTMTLSISSNSCLRCKWDVKLGYPQQRRRHQVIRRLDSNIYDDGGLITMMDVVICRKYPMMYSETLPNGISVKRNSKDEEYHRRTLEQECSPPGVANAKLADRRVSGYFRLRLCDVHHHPRKKTRCDQQKSAMATLTVTQASEVMHMDLKEGHPYRLYFIQPYQPKARSLQGLYLITTRLTKWEHLMPTSSSLLTDNANYPLRSICPCAQIKDLTSTDVDMAVYVLHTQIPSSQQAADGRIAWYSTLLVTDKSQTICQITYRSHYRFLQDMTGQIIGFTNVRFDLYDSKCDIVHVKTSDESEIWTKPTATMMYMQQSMKDLKHWTESTSSELTSLQQRVKELIP